MTDRWSEGEPAQAELDSSNAELADGDLEPSSLSLFEGDEGGLALDQRKALVCPAPRAPARAPCSMPTWR